MPSSVPVSLQRAGLLTVIDKARVECRDKKITATTTATTEEDYKKLWQSPSLRDDVLIHEMLPYALHRKRHLYPSCRMWGGGE